MNSYEYINSVQGASSIAVDTVDASRIYTIDREGIGIRQETSSGGTVEATAYEFTWYATAPGPVAVPGMYHIRTVTNGVSSTTVLCEIGPVTVVNVAYTFKIFGESVVYVTQSGDTATDIRNALVALINGYSWAVSVTVTSVSTTQYQVIVNLAGTEFLTRISLELYKSGYYCEFSLNGGPVKQYLIEQNSAGDAYPPFGVLASSYLYTDLTLAPAGIENLLYVPNYTQEDFDSDNPETIDITNSPQVGSPAAGKCLYYDGMIYFGPPTLNVGERIKMIII